MSAPLRFDDLPLRQRKAARTRQGLIESAVRRMQTRRFSDVPVSALCRDVGVTEQTFFNYFPTKEHLLVHLILLWGIETEWHARRVERRRRARGTIEAVFDRFAQRVHEAPRVAAELLARQALREGPPEFPEIALADRLIWFPDLEGIEALPEIGILGILRVRIQRAIAEGDLPPRTDPAVALTTLGSVFFGIVLVQRALGTGPIQAEYRRQLAIAWRGLGG